MLTSHFRCNYLIEALLAKFWGPSGSWKTTFPENIALMANSGVHFSEMGVLGHLKWLQPKYTHGIVQLYQTGGPRYSLFQNCQCLKVAPQQSQHDRPLIEGKIKNF